MASNISIDYYKIEIGIEKILILDPPQPDVN